MSARVILDTGPLVALLVAREQHHDWAKRQFAVVEPPLFTCEAVLSECLYLLAPYEPGVTAVVEMLRRGVIAVPFQFSREVESVSRLLHKYRDVPASFADACLIRMSEQSTDVRIMTLDSDFTVYRRHGRQPIPLIMPDDSMRPSDLGK